MPTPPPAPQPPDQPSTTAKSAVTKRAATKSTVTKSTVTRSAAAKATTAKSAAAKPAPSRRRAPRWRGVPAIRERLLGNATPIVFVGSTPYNLLGLERWVGGLRFVCVRDPFDGAHPRVFVPAPPSDVEGAALLTPADVTNHLLRHPQVRAHLADLAAAAGTEKLAITAVATDEESERLVAELGYALIAPTTEQRERVETVVPPTEDAPPAEQTGIRSVSVAAVVTRHGTVVGPAVSSLVGDPMLTPDPYAWCGAETSPSLLSAAQRARAAELIQEAGVRLAHDGFRGYLEAHLQLGYDAGSEQLTGMTAGIGAATAVSTTAAASYADLPPYALHVLEHLGVDYELDVTELNRRASDLAIVDGRRQLLISDTGWDSEVIADAPVTGRYAVDRLGRAHLVERSLDWHGMTDPDEFYFLRIAGPGDLRWTGADLGIVVAGGRAGTVIAGVRAGYLGFSALPELSRS